MIGIAIIGYGYWGPKLARNFLQHGGFDPIVICEERPERLALALRENPSALGQKDFLKVLSDPAIGAVAFATPVHTHFPLVKVALEAGKHVLVEKPLATAYADAENLVELAHKNKRTLMVDHTFVYHPAIRKIRALIENGELGRLNYIDSTRINLGLFQHDVNVLWDLATHDLSIINFLVSERPVLVQAIGAQHTSSKFENIGILVLRYASGLFAHINCSWVSPVKIRHMLIGGDRKMVVYDDLNANEPVKIYDSGVIAKSDEDRSRLLFEYRAGDVYSPRIPQKEALAVLVGDFAAAISQGASLASDGIFGAEIVKILEAAQLSIKDGGREVSIQWK